jgi:hypothetical protein
MPAVRTVQHVYARAPERLFTLLRDPDYLRRRCIGDGDRNIRIDVRAGAAGPCISVERDRTIELPALVRGLIKPTNRVLELYTWQRSAGGWQADYEVSSRGMPGTLRGAIRLEGDALATLYEATIEVTARLPLLASKLETLMADGFAAYLQLNAAHAERELSEPLLPYELAHPSAVGTRRSLA